MPVPVPMSSICCWLLLIGARKSFVVYVYKQAVVEQVEALVLLIVIWRLVLRLADVECLPMQGAVGVDTLPPLLAISSPIRFLSRSLAWRC